MTDSPLHMIPVDLREAAALLLPGHREMEPVAGQPAIARVKTNQGWTRVTRWSEGVTAERIAAIHALFQHAGEAGIRAVPLPFSGPNGEASIALPGGHRYDARQWLPGQPTLREEPIPGLVLPGYLPLDHLAAAATTIGRVHTASAMLITQRRLPAMPLTMIHQAVAIAGQQERRSLAGKDRVYPPMRRWLRASERIIPAAANAIGALQEGEGRRFVAAHANLWPEHLLFTRPEGMTQLSGITGWSRLFASSPLVDLAQIVTRNRGWSQEAAETVLEAYQATASLLPEERRALPMIAGVDLLSITGPLIIARVRAATGEQRFSGMAVQVLQLTLERLLDALDQIVPLLTGYDEKSPKRGRTWVYRTPPVSGPRHPRPKPKPRGN